MLKRVFGLVCTALVAIVLVGSMTGCGDDKKKTTTTGDKGKSTEPPPTNKR